MNINGIVRTQWVTWESYEIFRQSKESDTNQILTNTQSLASVVLPEALKCTFLSSVLLIFTLQPSGFPHFFQKYIK